MRVLFVEDEPNDYQFYIDALRSELALRHGELHLAHTLEQTLCQLERVSYDAVVLDLNIPLGLDCRDGYDDCLLNGKYVVAYLRDRPLSDTRVVCFTNHLRQARADLGMDLTGITVLPKSSSRHAMLQGRVGYGLADITDLVGVRVVVEGRACAAHMSSIVRQMFTVREADCEDFLDTPRTDGYRGIHLILDIESDAANRTAIPVELQVRTILQHQWSVLSHSEFYKQVAEIPQSMLLRMRSLGEILHCAEIESDQLRRGRIADECARILRDLLAGTIERLALAPDGAAALGQFGLHLLEFDRKLRRTLVSTGDRERRAFDALESLAEADQLPGSDPDAARRLAEIVRRVRIVVMPCYPG